MKKIKITMSCLRKSCLLFIPFLLGITNNTVNMVDPTRPPDPILMTGQPAIINQPLLLTAIFIYPTFRLAIINGRSVMIGDKINDLIITAITPFTVDLIDSDNKKQELQLAPLIKQRRS